MEKKSWKKKKDHKHSNCTCGNAKCFICHSDKVFHIPDKQRIRAKDIEKFEIKNLNKEEEY